MLLSLTVITASVLMVCMGVINGAYVLCSFGVHLMERGSVNHFPPTLQHEIFNVSKQKEIKLTSLLDGGNEYTVLVRQLFLSAGLLGIIMTTYLLAAYNMISFDSLVRLACFVDLKTTLLFSGALTLGVALLGNTVAFRDLIRFYTSLLMEMIFLNAAISSCHILKTKDALIFIVMATCLTGTLYALVHPSEIRAQAYPISPPSSQVTLFLHRGVGEICSIFVDLRVTGRELLEKVSSENPLTIPLSSRLTWCGKNLRSDIPLFEYGVHNLSTLFIEDAGLKGGCDNCSHENDSGDEGHTVGCL